MSDSLLLLDSFRYTWNNSAFIPSVPSILSQAS